MPEATSGNDEMKRCPMCCELILAMAKKCKHCGEYLTDDATPQVAGQRAEKSRPQDVQAEPLGAHGPVTVNDGQHGDAAAQALARYIAGEKEARDKDFASGSAPPVPVKPVEHMGSLGSRNIGSHDKARMKLAKALIKCPACDRKISSLADTCPKCGYPVIREGTTQAHDGKSQTIEKTSKEKELELKMLLSVLLCVISVIIAIIGIDLCVNKNSAGWVLLVIGAIGLVVAVRWRKSNGFKTWWRRG
jgi:hypothetical protein